MIRVCRIVTLVLALAFIGASPLAAQSNPDILTSIDTPNGTVQYAAMIHLWGWSFSCSSGQQPFGVRISYVDQFGHPTPLNSTGLISWRQSRADVKNAFVAYCPELGTYTGWAIDIRGGIPPGPATFRIDWIDRYGEQWTSVSLMLQ